MKISFDSIFYSGLLVLFLFACTPKEDIVFKGVKNIAVEVDSGNDPILKAEAFFHNPNAIRMKLKEINVDVLVEGKTSAHVRQNLKLIIPAQADFSVPLEAKLSLKELGLVNTIVSLLGGKKYEVQYVGYIRVKVHGVTIKVPVKHKEELRLRL